MAGQVNVIGGEFKTANVFEHVLGASHTLVTVYETNLTPPHADGAPSLLFERA